MVSNNPHADVIFTAGTVVPTGNFFHLGDDWSDLIDLEHVRFVLHNKSQALKTRTRINTLAIQLVQ